MAADDQALVNLPNGQVARCRFVIAATSFLQVDYPEYEVVISDGGSDQNL